MPPHGQGSSPRVRGSLTSRMSFGDAMGIIPAGAGLTGSPISLYVNTWDHPRGCGDHHEVIRTERLKMGSSPRVRGSLTRKPHGVQCLGIIPAGAGLTMVSSAVSPCFWDHPRGCGAHKFHYLFGCFFLGSSPRVRGSHPERAAPHALHGIIPAGAGLTFLKN